MKQKNSEVRNAIADSGFCYWEIAEKLGVADATFSRYLRKEFTPDMKARVMDAIDDLRKEAEINES